MFKKWLEKYHGPTKWFVLWGMAFALVRVNIAAGTLVVPLLPDVIGFALLLVFARAHAWREEGIARSRRLWFVLTLFGLFDLAMKLTGLQFSGPIGAGLDLVFWLLLGAAGTNLLSGLCRLARRQGAKAEARLVSRTFMTAVVAGAVVIALTGLGIAAGTAALILQILQTLLCLLHLYALWRMIRALDLPKREKTAPGADEAAQAVL